MTILQKFKLSITLLSVMLCNNLFANTKSFIPDAPIINFRLPMFNNEGFQAWHVHGEQGIYLSDEQVDIVGMTLTIFSGDEKNLCEATIKSPIASVFLYDNKAQSSDNIEICGDGYTLFGKNWFWDGKSKKIIINQNVKVIFNQSLFNLNTSYEKS